jgi:predicted secreted protein
MSAKLEFVPATGEATLFDSLARLVPDDLKAEYYRVLAHTRTLSPDDEMLRILEAMGVLALLTRQTPKEMAEERERFQTVLDRYEQCSDVTQEKMRDYLHGLETRVGALPKEIESALNPVELATLLGESLRQHFLRTGFSETAEALQVTSATAAKAQEQLATSINKLCDQKCGVLAQVASANSYLTYSLESRARKINELLFEVRNDILRLWIPLLCGATLLIGLFGGAGIQSWRDDRAASDTQPPVAAPIGAEAPVVAAPHNQIAKEHGSGSRPQPYPSAHQR